MRKYVLATVLVFIASGAQSASYQQVGGNIAEPILCTGFGLGCPGATYEHPYVGVNLGPGVQAPGAFLSTAYLVSADLSYANLIGSHFQGTNIRYADFSHANLTNADFGGNPGAYIKYANFTGAILIGANLQVNFSTNWWTVALEGARYSLNAVDNSGNPIPDTIFGPGLNPVTAGMILVPEPSTALLLGLGLVGLSARRRG